MHIDRLLENAKTIYCIVIWIILKPFNDAYGYRRGDELIQFIGHLLSTVAINDWDFLLAILAVMILFIVSAPTIGKRWLYRQKLSRF
jgi:hypothetical protein